MAIVKRPYKKEGEKVIIHCDIPNEEALNCYDCAHCMIKEPWCDGKCFFPNHVMNKIMPGLACEDFLKKDK